MMEIIINIVGFACIAHLLADFLQQFEEIPKKPFACNMCLGFWISLFPNMWLYGLQGILVSAIVGVVSETIYKRII